MKFLIIGLGNFGSTIADKLTQMGHEVIGVDKDMNKVEAFKETITHTICLDSQDPQAVSHLPVKDTDIVIVCIGEDEGANIMATALMKRLKVKRLISRAISPLHVTVLEAMGITEIVHPEAETADRWTKKLTMKGIVDSFILSKEYGIIEAEVPEKFVEKKLMDLDLIKKHNIMVLTTINITEKENKLGVNKKTTRIQGIATSDTELKKEDIIVMYGKINDIEKFLEA